MSNLEKVYLICATLLLYLMKYVPVLFNGIFNANSSNASSLYSLGLLVVIGNAIMWVIFVYVLIGDSLKKIKKRFKWKLK